MRNYTQDEINRMLAYMKEVKNTCNGRFVSFKMSNLFHFYNVPLNTGKILQLMGYLEKQGTRYRWIFNGDLSPTIARHVWDNSVKRTADQTNHHQRMKTSDAYKLNSELKDRVAKLEKQVAEKSINKENNELMERIKQLESQLND